MCLLKLAKSDNYNWQDLLSKPEHEGRHAVNVGFKEYSAIIMERVPYIENAVSIAISIINGNFDFSEDKDDKAMNWVKGVSPKIGDYLEKHYLKVIMEGSADLKFQLKVFRDQTWRRFRPSG